MLSREQTGIPETEAKSLVADLDPLARFSTPEGGLVLAETTADPAVIEGRVAFSRRVGALVPDSNLGEEHLSLLRSGTYRVRVFGKGGDGGERDRAIIRSAADRVRSKVSLENPDREVSAFVGEDGTEYMAITSPGRMRQGWVERRPRSRAFFHPSAIFPKLSRALVNLSGVQQGEVFLDPFCGTGSLLIEASIIGADPLGVDLAKKMVRGARRNSMKYGQAWLGLIRADSRQLPINRVSGIATDIPYGRASSRHGSGMESILSSLVETAARVLPRGRKLVVMHPKSTPVPKSGQLTQESEVNIYIHRTLTRSITVMRRNAT